MTIPYTNNLDHLRDELSRLELAIRLGVERFKASDAAGLYVSDAAVDTLLDAAEPPSGPEEEDLLLAIEEKREQCGDRMTASLAHGVPLRLPRLARTFRLSPFEADVLLVLLAPELDLKYERLYAYLQDDATRRYPTVDLVCRLLCRMPDEWALARGAFLPSARLVRYGLARYLDSPEPGPLLTRRLRLDDRIVDFLLESDGIDPRIAHCARLVSPQAMDGTFTEAPLAGCLKRYLDEASKQQWIGLFHGPDSQGQEQAVRNLCGVLNLPLLEIDFEALAEDAAGFDGSLRLVLREAALSTAALCLRHTGSLDGDGEKSPVIRRSLEAALRDLGWIVFITGPAPWDPPDSLKRQWFFRKEFPLPAMPERAVLWEGALRGTELAGDVAIEDLAAGFHFGPREIGNAVALAANHSMLRGDADFRLSQTDLLSACRTESSQRLLAFARRVNSPQSWSDLVLPKEQTSQLLEILDYIRHHEIIFSEWGFGAKLGLGKGVNVLFSGPSGTGKTMAGSILANELGLDIYKIDLSSVVSKYIGETEKNLNHVFRDAESSNGILFFDEADALFGKRSEVKDAHDRYANIEVNYLLQKMEEHEGIVILATNFGKNLDESFVRRLQFTLLFPFPEREERLKIWRGIFPDQAPLGKDMDLEFLARRLKISGGNIKNIALSAAFLARSEDHAIGMRHVILAAKREFQKMGKLCLKADFGDYYELVT